MGIPLTYVDGNGPLVEWKFNGTDLRQAYLNGVLIFEKPIILHLPCNPNYTSANLEDFIKANNPNDYKLVFVYLDAGCSHPTLYTGNLSHWYVSLIIEGSLEAGTSSSTAALIMESTTLLTNNGYIRGYGGHGGDGGDGKPGSSYTVDTTSSAGPYYGSGYDWYVTCGPFPGSRDVRVTGSWPGVGSFTIQSRATPCTSQKTSGSKGDCTYYRGSLQVGDGTCDGDTYDHYSIRRKCGGTKTYSAGGGGNGGAGGSGQYYKHPQTNGSNGSSGSAGGHPEQTRGHSGCKGGNGGTWGQSGGTGSGGGNCYSGSGGSGGGNAIKGARFLDPASQLNDGGSPDRVQGKILQ